VFYGCLGRGFFEPSFQLGGEGVFVYLSDERSFSCEERIDLSEDSFFSEGEGFFSLDG
jgi:hypothetical protein